MRIDVISLFPEMLEHAVRFGVTGRAIERGLWQLRCWNPRDHALDAYRRVDDRPFGGGPGMVMLPGPLAACLGAVRAEQATCLAQPAPVIHLSPRGRPLTQRRVRELADLPAFVLLCSRYEGVDQRFLDRWVDEEVSVGDFVVSGGELPALSLMDAVVRLLPGVLTDPQSAQQDSFSDGLLEGPHYTRPEDWDGTPVPSVLLSGHHAQIARWRREAALEVTASRRPDLIEAARAAGRLSDRDEDFLRRLG